MFKPLPLFIGLRYTRAKRRNHFISFISLTSMLGMILGVAVFMVVWLVLGFAGVLGPVANLAHLGGGLIGLIQAWFDRGRRAS